MEELCALLDMRMGDMCLDWLRKAVEHCNRHLQDFKGHDSDLWTAMRSAFASDQEVDDMLPGISIDSTTSPENLSYGECGTLLTSIARDYFARMPYFPIMSAMSVGAWTIWLAILGMFLILSFTYITVSCSRKLDVWYNLRKRQERNFATSTPRTDQVSIETSNGLEEIKKTITFKVSPQSNENEDSDELFKTAEGLEINCCLKNSNGYNNTLQYKRAALEEILNFLEYYPQKLEIIMEFDDESIYEDMMCQHENKSRTEQRLPSPYIRSPSFLTGVSGNTSVRSRIPVAAAKPASNGGPHPK